MSCLSETILSSISVHMCCFYSLICSQLFFCISASSREPLRSDTWAVCPNSHFNLHFISFTTSMWFEDVTKVPLTWKQPSENSWRKSRTKRRRNSVKTNRSHLNDPISRLDSSPHRRSIWDTEHRGGETGTRGKGQTRVEVSLTFFDQLHKNGIVSTHSQPKAIFISLDYHTALDETWTHTNTHLGGHKQAPSPSHHIFGKMLN